jgi:hypothetical protein
MNWRVEFRDFKQVEIPEIPLKRLLIHYAIGIISGGIQINKMHWF